MHLACHVTYILYAVEPDLQQPIPPLPAQYRHYILASTRARSRQLLTRPL